MTNDNYANHTVETGLAPSLQHRHRPFSREPLPERV